MAAATIKSRPASPSAAVTAQVATLPGRFWQLNVSMSGMTGLSRRAMIRVPRLVSGAHALRISSIPACSSGRPESSTYTDFRAEYPVSA